MMNDAYEAALQRWERERAERDEFCRGSQWTEEQQAAIRATLRAAIQGGDEPMPFVTMVTHEDRDPGVLGRFLRLFGFHA
jgi:hypothetical protein